MHSGRLFDTGETVLHYTRHGTQGPALLLLHEMGGTLHSWDKVVALLGGRCRLLAQDLRGFGLSGQARAPVTLADLANDTAALIRDEFPDQPVWLAGCAVGAGVALQLALDHPQLVAGVVALAPATGVPPERRAQVLDRIDRLERDGTRPFFPALQERQFPARFRDDPEWVTRFHLQRLAADASSYAAIWRALVAADLDPRLAGLDLPVTVVAGLADDSRPPAQLQALAAAIPGATFCAIDSGHAMHVITPAAVARIIARTMGLTMEGHLGNAR